ncbi:MAG: acyloxyacyl hydrolase [Desulfobacterales bacterium]|nr:acyloxyacyl hydrolase [Desulfobacterales bacterium]MBF0396350.1 acyloxyacyl hydrolase [Desulfobacterales bacterium]
MSYDPNNDIKFNMISGFLLFDYDKIWKHKAPDELYFKVEANFGITNQKQVVASSSIFALYYLDKYSLKSVRPYVEAGIGLVYTDFQIHKQGLRVNFNPQAGIGAEFFSKKLPSFFLAFRLNHLSNGNLHKENRGINSVFLQLGHFFN